MPSPAKRIRYFFEWTALYIAFLLVPATPRCVVHAVARLLGTLAFFIHAEGRRTAIANLHAAFPGRFTEEEVEDLALRCYRSWARTYLDQLWTRNLTRDTYRDYLSYEIPPNLNLDAVRETGAIWMMPHYSNFEWGAAGIGFLGIHYTAIAQDFKNPRLTPLILKNREHLGHQIISREKSMLKLLRVLKRGGHAAFLPDLTIPPGQAATIIEVFGLKVCVTGLGPFLAQHTGCPIVCGITFSLPDGTYHVTGVDPLTLQPGDSIQHIAQRCWDAVEPFIARHPEHWLWMYKHFRFLPRASGRRYPPYANRSTRFDALEDSLAGGEGAAIADE